MGTQWGAPWAPQARADLPMPRAALLLPGPLAGWPDLSPGRPNRSPRLGEAERWQAKLRQRANGQRTHPFVAR